MQASTLQFQSPHQRGGSSVAFAGSGVPGGSARGFSPLISGAVQASRPDRIAVLLGRKAFQSPHQRGGSSVMSKAKGDAKAVKRVSVPSSAGRFKRRWIGSFGPNRPSTRFQSPHQRGGSSVNAQGLCSNCNNKRVSVPSSAGRFKRHGLQKIVRPKQSAGFSPLISGAVQASQAGKAVCHVWRGVSVPSSAGRFKRLETKHGSAVFTVKPFQSPHQRGGSTRIPQVTW